MLMSGLACVLQPAYLQREKLGLGDLRDHPGQLFLHKLMRCNWLVAELFPQLGILQSGVITGHGRANRPPSYAVARLVEAHQRRFQASDLGRTLSAGMRTS